MVCEIPRESCEKKWIPGGFLLAKEGVQDGIRLKKWLSEVFGAASDCISSKVRLCASGVKREMTAASATSLRSIIPVAILSPVSKIRLCISGGPSISPPGRRMVKE